MNTINDFYVNALLADAAYVKGVLESDSDLAQKLSKRMTPSQAQYIADNFTVISAIDTSDYLGSGFDALVWKGKPGSAYAGKVYISMRGTEDFGDFLADTDLALLSGSGRAQIMDMVNWWLRITTATTGQAKQIKVDPLSGNFVLGSSIAGTGQLVGVTHVEVDGHSLGGHLAAAFARLFGGTLGIDAVTTFNSAGFHANSEPVFQQLEGLLGTGAGRFLSEKQTNIFAQNGINVTTNSFFFNQVGQRVSVFNEEGSGIPNHYMYKLTDSLALMDVMNKIDTNLSLATANQLLGVGSAQPAASLEAILDALRRIYSGPSVAVTQIGDAEDSPSSRVDFQQKLTDLRALIAGDATLRGSFASLSSLSADTLTTLAQSSADAQAYRYALKELNPFALLGANYGIHNAAGELNLAKDGGELTDQYLTDRAQFLAGVIEANTNDTGSGKALRVETLSTELIYFKDEASGLSLQQQNTLTNDGTEQKYLFGGTANDTLTGADEADHLYGGAGIDTLDGGKGKSRMKRTHLLALLFCALSVACGNPQADTAKREEGSRLTRAEAIFQERCKSAGEKIYRTAENVEGIFLMKLRPKGINYGEQFQMDDPYGNDLGGNGYITSLVRGSFQANTSGTPAPGSPPRLGYRYVEALDPADGKRYRYTGARKAVGKMDATAPNVQVDLKRDPKFDLNIYAFVLDKTPSPGSQPRYGVTYDDISTHEERELWIAGSSLKVIDLKTNEVMAERIGYMMDRGQGERGGGRSPWLLAADNACPTFARNPLLRLPPGRGAAAQVRQTQDFVEKILKPSLEK